MLVPGRANQVVDWKIEGENEKMPETKKAAGKPAPAGEVVLDFSDVKPFEPIDSGIVYDGIVSVMKPIEPSKASGKPKSSVEVTITGPEEVGVEEWIPDDEAEGGYRKGSGLVAGKTTNAKNRKLFREFSLESKALPFLYEFIKAADPEAELDESFKYNPKNYEGLPVKVRIENEAFNEQIRPRIKKFLPA